MLDAEPVQKGAVYFGYVMVTGKRYKQYVKVRSGLAAS